MSISSIVGRILPAATSFVTSGGNPIAAAASFAAADKARDQKKQARLAYAEYEAQQRELKNMDPLLFQNFGATTTTAPQPQLGFFDRLSNTAGRIGNQLLTGFEAAIPSFVQRQIGGGTRPQQAVQQPALTTITNVGAQESQGSGSIEAGAGNLLAPLLQAGRSLLKSPGGQLAIGTGTGLAFSGMGSSSSGMRMTRKMKSQARMVLNMTGGNLSAAADILGIDQNTLVMLLLKRFRNDGPVVTKAALRKTKQTIRRLHSMQDVLKSITPTATMRRRTPMKRASTTTLIKN
jgi:hypothetical protein